MREFKAKEEMGPYCTPMLTVRTWKRHRIQRSAGFRHDIVLLFRNRKCMRKGGKLFNLSRKLRNLPLSFGPTSDPFGPLKTRSGRCFHDETRPYKAKRLHSPSNRHRRWRNSCLEKHPYFVTLTARNNLVPLNHGKEAFLRKGEARTASPETASTQCVRHNLYCPEPPSSPNIFQQPISKRPIALVIRPPFVPSLALFENLTFPALPSCLCCGHRRCPQAPACSRPLPGRLA